MPFFASVLRDLRGLLIPESAEIVAPCAPFGTWPGAALQEEK
jgi:hypothetical protein